MGNEIVAAELDIEFRKYRRNMDEALRKAKALDVGLENVEKAGRKVDKSLNAIKGGVNVDIKADTSDIDKVEGKIKAIDGASPTITPEVDDGKFKSFLEGLKNGAVLGVSVVGAAGVGAGVAIAEDIRSDRAAVGAFALSTGQTREEAAAIGETINTVWNTGLAETKTEIAGVAASFYQAGVAIDEIGAAATDAFTIAAATGEDVNEIVRAQITLVNTGLATSYSEASDIIAGGFAEGLNRAGDFLDTINEYSRDFADLGLSADTFFGILDTGLDAGAYNTDKIADAFRELKIRVDTALSSGTGTEFEGLKTLGLLDEAAAYRAGEITGEQWVAAVLSVTNAANLDAVVTGAFGSPIEDLGVGVFESINAAFGNPELLATWRGTTETMRDTLSDNLDTAFKRAYNVVVNDLASGIQIAGKSLTDVFDELPKKLNEFSDLVASGVGIPEALEIVLEAPGLAQEMRQLQANLGGFIIELQFAIASFLEGIGRGDAAGNLRASTIAQAQSQLAFDIQYLDPDQVTRSIATALRRGVDESGVSEAISEAGANLIADDKLKRFQEILDRISGAAYFPAELIGRSNFGGPFAPTQTVNLGLIETTRETLGETQAALANNLETTGVWAKTWAEFGDVISFDADAILEAAGYVEQLGIRTAESDDNLVSYADAATTAADNTQSLGDRAGVYTNRMSTSFETSADRSIAALDRVNRAMLVTQQLMFDTGVDPAAFAAYVFTSGSGGGGQFATSETIEGSHASGLSYVPHDGYIAELHKGEAVLTASQALQYFSMGGGGNTSINTVNINVNQSLNAGGMAQASAAGSRFANQIRGFA